MNSSRRAALVTGGLLIGALVAVLMAGALEPDVTQADHLARAADAPWRTRLAVLLHLVAAAGSVGIAIALYPVLRPSTPWLALTALIARAIEATMYAAAVVPVLGIHDLSQRLAGATPDEQAAIAALGDSLVGVRDHTIAIGVLAFSAGALAYYVAFARSRLTPRWLSGWGIGAALIMMTAVVLSILAGTDVRSYALLILPILLQEQVLGVWLLVKGFAGASAEKGHALTGSVASPSGG